MEPLSLPGITAEGVSLFRLDDATRGATRGAVADSVFDLAVDAGPGPTFVVDGTGSLVAEPSAASVLLVQDVATGRLRWDLGSPAPGGRRFAFDESTGAPERGPLGLAARFIAKAFGKAGADVAGNVTEWAVSHWERRARPSRLRWYASGGEVAPADLRGRSLLLLHDLFGRSSSSFGALPQELSDAMRARYDDKVWVYEHPTLASAPAENAAQLVDLLRSAGSGVAVDVFAHGRGGLVAIELARLEGRSFDIGRIVLAGTPVRGTPLCDVKYLVKLADRYVNLLSLLPDNPVTTIFDGLAAFVVELSRHAVARLSGVGAMASGLDGALPTGPAFLALGGDFEPTGSWLDRVRDDVVDRLLGDHNDLFVPVASAVPPDISAQERVVIAASHQALCGPEGTEPIGRFLGLAPAPGAGASVPSTVLPAQTAESRPSPPTPSERVRRARTYTVLPRPTEPTVEPVDIDVRVVHASLEYASHTLLVGHYRGAEISGAEASLDARLEGRLTRRHVARLYPEEPGDSDIFDNRADAGGTDFPREAMVIGLGSPGELTRTRLTDAVTAGLLRLALATADNISTDEPRALRVSPMIIGTRGTAPLRIDVAVAAIVDAVLAANGRLVELRAQDQRPLFDLVHYDAVEFLELHLDRAELAAHAVAGIHGLVTSSPRHSRLRPVMRLRSDEGGWPARLAFDDDPGWRRIVIRGRDPHEHDAPARLTYTSVGNTSLSEALEMQPNQPVVAALLAMVDSDRSSAIGATLFEALVPVALRDEVVAADNVQFIVDAESARYPWEALVIGRQGAAARAASQRGGMIRQFVNTEGMRGRARVSDARDALVIGNPPTDLQPLPDAFDEADRVARLLEAKHYRVQSLRWDDQRRPAHTQLLGLSESSAEIFHALAFPHRILHIAAHGIDDGVGEPGVVIGPHNARLRARDIAEFTTVPELVVLNCCHLAANPGLVANLAHAFMEKGAQAVVAAAWAVGDEAAKEFATTLYEGLLDGATFGSAVQRARNRAADTAPGSMTWAAYQCYGDPGYRVEVPSSTGGPSVSIVSDSELSRQIEIIVAKAGDVGRPRSQAQADDREHLAQSLTDLLAEAEADDSSGGARPRLDLTAFARARVAFAFGELGYYDKAIDWYRRAICDEKATFPMSALEQLGNLEIRLAQQLHRRGDTERVEELVKASHEHLTGALYVGKTGERLALLGSHYKKLASIRSAEQRPELLKDAVRAYADAYDVLTASGRKALYPRLNWIQLHQLAYGRRPDGVGEDIEDASESAPDGRDSFWKRGAVGDVLLTRLVTGGTASTREVAAAYIHAFDFRSSWRERSSVRDHLADLSVLCADALICSKLHEIRDQLTTWIDQKLGQAE